MKTYVSGVLTSANVYIYEYTHRINNKLLVYNQTQKHTQTH